LYARASICYDAAHIKPPEVARTTPARFSRLLVRPASHAAKVLIMSKRMALSLLKFSAPAILKFLAPAIICALACAAPLHAQTRRTRTRNATTQATPAPNTPTTPTTRTTQQTAASPAPSPSVPEEDADLVIIANVHAKELTFETVPNPTVEFPGRPQRATEWSAERENLPRPVEPGVTYRDIGIRLKIVSRFADIDRIVAEALGETPPTDDAPQPSATPPNANETAYTNDALTNNARTNDARVNEVRANDAPPDNSQTRHAQPRANSNAARAATRRRAGAHAARRLR
jgi:hypothetical protein